MNIRVLFFGATADIAGTRVLNFRRPATATAGEVLKEMVERYPALASYKLHLSINQQFATGHELIIEGDELAIFTAVSGG
ncbi:MAG TPA: MoaD/ThiS family protein [Pyrinomonadaceae bacterium]|nr:MoaD/ThiS family protein [Pyrinomonadaceae bacterium]